MSTLPFTTKSPAPCWENDYGWGVLSSSVLGEEPKPERSGRLGSLQEVEEDALRLREWVRSPGGPWSSLGGRLSKLAVGMVSGKEGPRAGVKEGQQRARVMDIRSGRPHGPEVLYAEGA